jgi:hypothetical protein
MDYTELATVVILGILAGLAIVCLDAEGKDVAIAVAGGLVGYLTKSNSA